MAEGHGNSVPRFHIVWGTGPAIVKPFEDKMRMAIERGLVDYRPRHRVDELLTDNGAVTSVRGAKLVPSSAARGEASSRDVVGDFEFYAKKVLVTSGGGVHGYRSLKGTFLRGCIFSGRQAGGACANN